jgi:hypothetical protein
MWYLSYDCALKSLAFAVLWLDMPRARALLPRARAAQELLRRAQAGGVGGVGDVHALVRAAAALLAELRGCVRICDGETVDLAPGRADRSVKPVERTALVAAYVDRRVRPALAEHVRGPLTVLIEQQPRGNAPAEYVAITLTALHWGARETRLVPAALKNCTAVCAYAAFAARYASAYGANKAHARQSLRELENAFGTGVPASTAAARGHVADCVMQALAVACREAPPTGQ